MTLFRNRVIWSVVLSFIINQIVKAILKRDLRAIKDYGGMPSGHTALISGAVTSIGFSEGLDSPCFGLAVAFSLIILSDILRLRPLISKEVSHTPIEMIVGGILGFLSALFVSAVF
jgi:acid phosphatase family membrane protein YuiD